MALSCIVSDIFTVEQEFYQYLQTYIFKRPSNMGCVIQGHNNGTV